jgi:hypothetical protein
MPGVSRRRATTAAGVDYFFAPSMICKSKIAIELVQVNSFMTMLLAGAHRMFNAITHDWAPSA